MYLAAYICLLATLFFSLAGGAVGTAQRTLHRSGTGSTGHALNINFDMFCFGQENSSFPVGDGL